MAWTSPKTWNVGDKLTAALFNTNIRDNLLALYNVLAGTAQGFGTQLFPTSDANFFLRNDPLINFDANDYLYYDRTNNSYKFLIGGGNVLSQSGGETRAFADLRTDGFLRFFKNGTPPNPSTYGNAQGGGFGWNRTNGGAEVNWYNFWGSGFFMDIWNGSAYVNVWQVASNGVMGGKGFYSSGNVILGAGQSLTLAHGLASRPRFVCGRYSLGTDPTTALAYGSPSSSANEPYISTVDDTHIVVSNNSAGSVYVYVAAMA